MLLTSQFGEISPVAEIVTHGVCSMYHWKVQSLLINKLTVKYTR